ncbi:hypothetical protein LEP1GSC060_2157 [Leptospira weilii serovar Ranarum str. ICFT]|uniref:Uncharacterized protein n=1 Tax=Leptospira weilii serovar Ranarum str. ICFT TaxID=1218598 RepID=N1WSF8_9LEPT|nr:hypothetical protein LEP1GSC060_2157 [Leptospira weilii serovar Ranarum str. ICFT]
MIFLSFPDIQSISDLYPPKFSGLVRLISQFSSRFQEFKINPNGSKPGQHPEI